MINALELTGVNKMTLTLKVKRLTETAKLPTYAHDGDACFDLYADTIVYDASNETYEITTGIAVDIPSGYTLMIYSRSGHAFKYDMRLANCVAVIDQGFHGLIKVKLTHDRCISYQPVIGDRIAQAMLIQVPVVAFEDVDSLSESERGEGGLGSSGK